MKAGVRKPIDKDTYNNLSIFLFLPHIIYVLAQLNSTQLNSTQTIQFNIELDSLQCLLLELKTIIQFSSRKDQKTKRLKAKSGPKLKVSQRFMAITVSSVCQSLLNCVTKCPKFGLALMCGWP